MISRDVRVASLLFALTVTLLEGNRGTGYLHSAEICGEGNSRQGEFPLYRQCPRTTFVPLLYFVHFVQGNLRISRQGEMVCLRAGVEEGTGTACPHHHRKEIKQSRHKHKSAGTEKRY